LHASVISHVQRRGANPNRRKTSSTEGLA